MEERVIQHFLKNMWGYNTPFLTVIVSREESKSERGIERNNRSESRVRVRRLQLINTRQLYSVDGYNGTRKEGRKVTHSFRIPLRYLSLVLKPWCAINIVITATAATYYIVRYTSKVDP